MALNPASRLASRRERSGGVSAAGACACELEGAALARLAALTVRRAWSPAAGAKSQNQGPAIAPTPAAARPRSTKGREYAGSAYFITSPLTAARAQREIAFILF